MKLQLVVTVLLVGFMFTLSLAMAGEEGDARAVLQAIRMLLVSESHSHGELQQAENVTSAPSNQLLSMCNYVIWWRVYNGGIENYKHIANLTGHVEILFTYLVLRIGLSVTVFL